MQNIEIRYLGIPPGGLVAAAAAALMLLELYRRYLVRVKFPSPALPLVLRAAALFSIIALMANPAFYFDVKKPVPRRVAILIDNSQSMGITDEGARDDRLKIALDAAGDISRALHEHRSWSFIFSEHPSPAPRAALSSVKPFGQATWLLSSISEADTGEGLPITDIVAITDGRDNSGMTFTAMGGGARVHFAAAGRRGVDVNVSAGDVQAPSTAIAGQPLTIRGEVKLAGIPRGTQVVVELSAKGKRAAGVKVVSGGDSLRGYRYAMTFVPREAGMQTYTIRAVSSVKENTVRDNTRTIFIDVVSGKRKILLLDVPRWEFTFLNRRLSADDKVETRSLLLTPGRTAGSEKRQALSVGGLSQYRLVIAGAIGKASNAAEKSALMQYLSSGGSVVLLGGENSLINSGDAAWSRLLRPIRQSVAEEYSDPFSPRLTESGRASRFMRVLPGVDENAELWSNLPYIHSFNPMSGPAGMDILARHPWADCGGVKCALAGYARVGRGRLFVFAFEGLWRWELVRRPTGAFDKLLDNVTAPLLEPEETRPVRLTLRKRNYTLGSEVCFEASVDPAVARASKPAAVVMDAGGETVARPSLVKHGGAGFLHGCYTPVAEGLYRVKVSAGGASSGDEPFAVEVARDEFLLTSANMPLLENIAKKTGGTVRSVDDAGALAEELARPGQWRTMRVESELWHPPYCWYFLAWVVSLLSLEWFVRRRGGLT